ncbi:hypothetical protein CEQ90_13635 [Lewinellaceae bacterium SD302]|nr:hypothetical protein CEQ90_13635 [Lewinellaceae bacterium SD302]
MNKTNIKKTPNENRPGYRKTKLGWLPEEWEVVRLEKITTIGNGTTPSKKEDRFWRNGSIPWLPTGKVNDAEICEADQFVTPQAVEETSLRLLPKDTVLIAMIGQGKTRGKAAITRIDATVNQNFAFIIANNKLNSNYLFSKLTFDYLKLRGSARGGGQESLNCGIIKKYKIPLPPLPEQTRIADLLSSWDRAIATTEKLLAAQRLRKKGLMQQLLSGKKRLPGFSGEWEEVRLGNYLIKHNETTTENNQYPVLTSSRKGLFFQKDYYKKQVASENNIGYNVVPRNYFTYRHMSDDLIFKFNINVLCDKGMVSTLYPVFRSNDIDQYYLLCLLNEGDAFKKYALQQKQGGSRTYMYFGKLEKLKINLPPLPEQTAIAKVLSAADAEITLLEENLATLLVQKKGLMQQLLTGEKRLLS